MNSRNQFSILVLCIVVMSLAATLSGILSSHGPGSYEYESIRGQKVKIYGKGFYQHMSSDVAVQGIAQDYVTLIIGIPMLLVSLFFVRKGSLRGQYLLTGTLGYFFVTYLFYMCMSMYSVLFLLFVSLASAGFYVFILSLLSFQTKDLGSHFSRKFPARATCGFLMFNAIIIALMWLKVIVRPLLDGTIYPSELEHYTTLIVQGLDLSILLPASFLSGFLLTKRTTFGYLLAPVYIIFLSLLMTALTAKVFGMTLHGVETGPAIVIIPLINAVAILFMIIVIRNIKEKIGMESGSGQS